ncbi:MAG: hypothetical protein CM15mV71_240 [Caudoviricetes sp.]|nr:MAG: hypothetical protein CM15mV71_240 [Caudoviricetes sp.]
MKDGFFQIIFESPPAEVELSTELKCREIMKSNDIDKIKAFCCDLSKKPSKNGYCACIFIGTFS